MQRQKAALLSIFSNTGLIIIKIIAGLLMMSVSVISEAIHSSIDLLASIIAFFSIKEAVKPPDKMHPFGHGKFENISGAFEAVLIFLAGILIISEGVKKIIYGGEIENLEAGIFVMLASSLTNFFISRVLLKIAKKEDSIALEADAQHLMTDVYTSAGVFLGLIILKITNIQLLDPIVAILVACLIIKTSIDLTRKSMKDLVDSSLSEEETNKIENIIKSHPEIQSHHKLRTRKSGNRREIDVHIQLQPDTHLDIAHEISHKVEREIKCLFPESYITIHLEPIKTNLNSENQ